MTGLARAAARGLPGRYALQAPAAHPPFVYQDVYSTSSIENRGRVLLASASSAMSLLWVGGAWLPSRLI